MNSDSEIKCRNGNIKKEKTTSQSFEKESEFT